MSAMVNADRMTTGSKLADEDPFIAFVRSIPRTIPTRPRFLLVQLATMVDWGDDIWPDDLAEATGYSDDTVRRYLDQLIEAGAVRWDDAGVHVALPGLPARSA